MQAGFIKRTFLLKDQKGTLAVLLWPYLKKSDLCALPVEI